MAIIPTTGKEYITGLIKQTNNAEPNAVAMGTGAGAEAAANTALSTEVETRTAGTSSQVTTTTANDTYRVVGTIAATATRAITESGLFNSTTVSGSILVARALFTVINLASGDSIQFTWEVRLS